MIKKNILKENIKKIKVIKKNLIKINKIIKQLKKKK